MTIKEGKIFDIKGGTEANWLQKRMKKALTSGDENANHWAEFLIGLNPGAHVTSNRKSTMGTHLPREEERRLGNVSIGWGRDTHLGGTFPAKFHGDGIVTDITMELDDVTIIEEGRWKLDVL